MKTEFTKGGFHHRQLKRIGEWALFERFKNATSPHYEVVRIRPYAAYELAGEKFPAGERYPSSESWGRDGFTYQDRDAAEARFAEKALSRPT